MPTIPAVLTKDDLRTLATRRGLVNLKPIGDFAAKTVRYVRFCGTPDTNSDPVTFEGSLEFESVNPDDVDSHGGYFDSLPLGKSSELPHNPPVSADPDIDADA